MGTGKVEESAISEAVSKCFDFRPAAIINNFQLRRPIYSATASEGHFGVEGRPWEATDLAPQLKALAGI